MERLLFFSMFFSSSLGIEFFMVEHFYPVPSHTKLLKMSLHPSLQRTELRPRVARPFSVVVAIDFGTTSSGYAFSFTEDPEVIHMMR